jgi:hypothetical protein
MTNSLNPRSLAASRANQTRRTRDTFRRDYPETAFIAEDILSGHDTETVLELNDATAGTVAAVKANLSRESRYSDLAHACNFSRR